MSCASIDPLHWTSVPWGPTGAQPSAPPPPDPPIVEVRATFRGVTTHARLVSQEKGRRNRRRRQFTIGSDSRVDAPVAATFVPWACHPLVMAAGTGYVVNATPAMTGEVRLNGQVQALSAFTRERGYTFALPPLAAARLDCGASTFFVTATSPPQRLAAPAWPGDWMTGRYLLGWAAGMALFLLLISFVPADPRALSLDIFGTDRVFVTTRIVPPALDPSPAFFVPGASAPASGRPPKARDLEGPTDGRMSSRQATRPATKGNPSQHQPLPSRTLALANIERAGILGVVRATRASHVASVFSSEDAFGPGAANVLDNLRGSELAGAHAGGGPAVSGTGSKEAGTGDGLLGPLGTQLNTVGVGQGPAGPDTGYGRDQGKLARRQLAVVPAPIPGIATVRGGLDKEIVRRTVRLHLNEIRFCYEQELARMPALAGRMLVHFTISGAGQVIASALQSSTLGNGRMENCAVQAVRRWQFPRPASGGLVAVSYPFLFTPGGK